jgi:hypothetical protein
MQHHQKIENKDASLEEIYPHQVVYYLLLTKICSSFDIHPSSSSQTMPLRGECSIPFSHYKEPKVSSISQDRLSKRIQHPLL